MKKYDAYLVCNDYIGEVRDFLAKFFKENKDEYSSDNSVTFVVPESNFKINLMKDQGQALSQNVTFEAGAESRGVLEMFAKESNLEIKTFLITEMEQLYVYNYIEVSGPHDICKIKIFYCEGRKTFN